MQANPGRGESERVGGTRGGRVWGRGGEGSLLCGALKRACAGLGSVEYHAGIQRACACATRLSKPAWHPRDAGRSTTRPVGLREVWALEAWREGYLMWTRTLVLECGM